MSASLTDQQIAAVLKALGIEAPAPARKAVKKGKAASTFYARVIASRQTCPRCARTFTPKSSGFAAGKHSRLVKGAWVPCK